MATTRLVYELLAFDDHMRTLRADDASPGFMRSPYFSPGTL